MQKEIIRDCQCGFRQNGSINDYIVCIFQIFQWGNGREGCVTMKQCTEYKEAYNLVGWIGLV